MDVLLYSKFSNESNKLMKQLSNTPDLLASLTTLCIDNKKVRDKIINDEKVKVTGLPCLIRLNDETGNFDIFEGSNAFDFFTKLQQQIKHENELKLEHERELKLEREREHEHELKLERERELKLERERELKLELERKKNQQFKSSNVNIIQEAKRQEQLRQQDQTKDVTRKEPGKKVSFTPIEDLEDLEDNSINTYTHVSKTDNSDFSERDQMDKTYSSQKSGSLLSKAMQMQKERN